MILRIFLLFIIFTLYSEANLKITKTIHLVGDSTVRNGNGHGIRGQWGWGDFLFLWIDPSKSKVINHARGGRSSRTFITEGHWNSVKNSLMPGDIILIQFGHNDGGGLPRNKRASLPGTGKETITLSSNGEKETVHTYGHYLRTMVRESKKQGAIPVLCSPVPRNIWNKGHIVKDKRRTSWIKEVAQKEKVIFLDLNEKIAEFYDALGQKQTEYCFQGDHTHTSRKGAFFHAKIVANLLSEYCEAFAPLIKKELPFKSLDAFNLECLSRGFTALYQQGKGTFLSWRFLGTDHQKTSFTLLRDGQTIYESKPGMATCFMDDEGSRKSSYTLKIHSPKLNKPNEIPLYVNSSHLFIEIPISPPLGGTLNGQQYSYSANDISVADLTGDGEYEFIIKWLPSNAKDNAHKGCTGPTILEAYKINGQKLWTINLGINIRSGEHYSPFIIYDLDGDGKAELVCKTADGTIDGQNNILGNISADFRGTDGRILRGPEYLSLFDGFSGKALHTVPYDPPRGDITSWGDSYGNRCDRFLAALAWIDGNSPSVIMCRGYYSRSVLVAYNIKGKKLIKRWVFDSSSLGNEDYSGQGNHNLAVADVDYDGYDEIIYGSCTIDHDGTGLYSTHLGHGDALHVGDFLPKRPGLEVWQCHESGKHGASLRDAATGEIILRFHDKKDTGRAIAGTFVPGLQTAAFHMVSDPNIYDGHGKSVAQWKNITKYSPNSLVWWTGDMDRSLLDKTMIDHMGRGRLLTAQGTTSNNGSKANACLSADILGDWREEVIWRTPDSSSLRIYLSTEPTRIRIPTLMHNRQYRSGVAQENVGYNQPPHPSFFMGSGIKKVIL